MFASAVSITCSQEDSEEAEKSLLDLCLCFLRDLVKILASRRVVWIPG